MVNQSIDGPLKKTFYALYIQNYSFMQTVERTTRK